MESLPIHGCCYNPSWASEELSIRGLALSTLRPCGERLPRNTEVIHDQGTPFVALSQPQAQERNKQVIHDEVTAFVALLRACTKNKDLYRGTRIHDDILKRGLLEKCSDALVTM
eukprot:c25279_g6_i1 orf=170-511(+)